MDDFADTFFEGFRPIAAVICFLLAGASAYMTITLIAPVEAALFKTAQPLPWGGSRLGCRLGFGRRCGVWDCDVHLARATAAMMDIKRLRAATPLWCRRFVALFLVALAIFNSAIIPWRWKQFVLNTLHVHGPWIPAPPPWTVITDILVILGSILIAWFVWPKAQGRHE